MGVIQNIPGPYERELRALGFTRTGDGKVYRAKDYVLESHGNWTTLHTDRICLDHGHGDSDFGLPGLWKSLPESGNHAVRVFQLPLALLGDGRIARQDETRVLRDCLEWATTTAAGALPDAWSAPPINEIEAILPSQALNVRAGTIVRRASLIHEKSRVALRCPIVPGIPGELSPGRRLWLQELLAEGQARWRMVRLANREGTTAEAEIDLSGAPAVVLEPLLRIAMDALRHVVRWLAPSIEFLSDPRRECRALELCRPQ